MEIMTHKTDTPLDEFHKAQSRLAEIWGYSPAHQRGNQPDLQVTVAILTAALWEIIEADTYTHTTPSGFTHNTTGAFHRIATAALDKTGDR